MTAGFGLEKLGLVTLKYPRASLLLVALLAALAVYGNSRLGFSSDIREIFRSGSTDFVALEEVSDQFPGSERDILILVDGPDLFTVDKLERLRDLHLDLGLVEGVASALSMFSARTSPDADGETAALIPADLAEVEDLAALRRLVQEHPLVAGRLFSEDGRLGLIVLSLTDEERDVDALRPIIAEVKDLADELLEGTGLDVTMTGTAVLRVEIIGALIRDQRTFRAIGLSVAVLLCWLFFRSIPYVVIALAPAALSIVALTGGMGLAGQDVNVLNNIIPSLVLVIAFASALHLLFAIRRSLDDGVALDASIEKAVREVGPACVLTSATTAIALLSLTAVPHPFIRGFGLTAACGTGFAYVAIMLTVPPLARLLLARWGDAAGWGKAQAIQSFFAGLSHGAARLVRENAPMIAGVGVALAVVAGLLHTLNKPHYQYQDNLPASSLAIRAIETINARLSGTNTLRLLIDWPDGHDLRSPQTLDTVADAHELLASEPLVTRVSSLRDVERWFVEGGRSRDDLFAFLEKTNTPLTQRILSPEHTSVLVTGYFGSMPAVELVALADRLDRKLEPLRAANPGANIALTGLVPVSAKASTEMIGQLNRSLLIAVTLIIVLIGLAFRSVPRGLASILPNVLPIFLAGAALFLTGSGLQFTSVVAFTIGFGIAVDSTIHVLNRYRLARQTAAPPEALDETILAIGPVLIVSTLVLIAGIGGTVFSELPMVRLYGQIIILLLTAALAGDLLFLPAIIRVVSQFRPARPTPGGGEKPKPRTTPAKPRTTSAKRRTTSGKRRTSSGKRRARAATSKTPG